MREAVAVLERFEVSYDLRVVSAHRTPERIPALARSAEEEGFRVVIAGAGRAAHLAGVFAAFSSLPVIGVAMESGLMGGIDALFSTIQMPAGIPVAATGIGSPGAKNAALFAVLVLALSDEGLRKRWAAYREGMAQQVAEQEARVRSELGLGT